MKHEKRFALNARRMVTREEAHAHIKERLRLPDWYGNNLDALNDCLGEINEPTRITVRFAQRLEQTPDGYGKKILGVLQAAADENEALQIVEKKRF